MAIRIFADIIGRMDRVGVTWSTGQELTFPSRKIESDFILWCQRKQMFGTDYPTEIVFGEAKSFGKDVFKKKNVNDAKFLAQNFPGAILVFATMKEAAVADVQEAKAGGALGYREQGKKYIVKP